MTDETDFLGGRDAAGRFVPGSSGGPGRPKLRPFREALRKRLREHPEELDAIVDTLFSNALGNRTNRFNEIVNEIEAAGFIRDTVEGRPTQAMILQGDEEGGAIRIECEGVDAKASDTK